MRISILVILSINSVIPFNAGRCRSYELKSSNPFNAPSYCLGIILPWLMDNQPIGNGNSCRRKGSYAIYLGDWLTIVSKIFFCDCQGGCHLMKQGNRSWIIHTGRRISKNVIRRDCFSSCFNKYNKSDRLRSMRVESRSFKISPFGVFSSSNRVLHSKCVLESSSKSCFSSAVKCQTGDSFQSILQVSGING